MALLGNVKACNTIFKRDSNPGGVKLAANKQHKFDTNTTSQAQYELNNDWLLLNNGHYPCVKVYIEGLTHHWQANAFMYMPQHLVPKHGAGSSKNRALSKKPKVRRLLPNLLEPSQPIASKKKEKL